VLLLAIKKHYCFEWPLPLGPPGSSLFTHLAGVRHVARAERGIDVSDEIPSPQTQTQTPPLNYI